MYKGLEEDFVIHMVKVACCPMLMGDINKVVWNEETLEVTLVEDAAWKEALLVFESVSWYINIEKLQVSPKKEGENYTAPEALFNLDAANLVTILHMKNDAKRAAACVVAADSDSEEEDDLDSASNEHDLGKLLTWPETWREEMG